jgi:hypothetical protein
LVSVGFEVLVGSVNDVYVWVRLGAPVRGVKVWVTKKVGACEGVRVAVRVGVNVMVGVDETVEVGAVEVGKGPKSILAVNAIAVLVLLAFLSVFTSVDGMLKATHSTNINKTDIPKGCR